MDTPTLTQVQVTMAAILTPTVLKATWVQVTMAAILAPTVLEVNLAQNTAVAANQARALNAFLVSVKMASNSTSILASASASTSIAQETKNSTSMSASVNVPLISAVLAT